MCHTKHENTLGLIDLTPMPTIGHVDKGIKNVNNKNKRNEKIHER